VEATVVKHLNLPEVALRNDITERALEGCIVIEAMKESYAEVNGKQKANMFYNMQRCCCQKLIRHTNRRIETTDTAKFD